MTTVEMAKGPGLPAHVHERTYEALMVVEGRLRVTLDGDEHVLTAATPRASRPAPSTPTPATATTRRCSR